MTTHEINLMEQEFETADLDEMEGGVEAPQIEPQQAKILQQHIKGIIEALLFASCDPLPLTKIREITDSVFPFRPKILRAILLELQQDYLSQRRAFRLEEIGGGYLLRSCEEFTPYVELLHRNKRSEKLSPAAAEVLAIIAYKQPITRPQIESIRGVDSSGVIQNLLERQLIEPIGRLEAPGRPTLYGITKDFLKHFGLRGVHDLPQIQI